jgi:hypothetical protein
VEETSSRHLLQFGSRLHLSLVLREENAFTAAPPLRAALAGRNRLQKNPSWAPGIQSAAFAQRMQFFLDKGNTRPVFKNLK